MSTTVTYKGSTLTTATNQTRVLECAGKVMEDDVTITDVTSGGSGGLEYEEGTFVGGGTVPTVSFSNSHTALPIFVLMTIASTTFDSTQNTIHFWLYSDWETCFGTTIKPSSSTTHVARVQYMCRTTSATSFSSGVKNLTTSTRGDYVTLTGFTPTGAAGTNCRSGGQYNWIAVWAPTT